MTTRTKRPPSPPALYWVSTEDGEEDGFIVGRTVAGARRDVVAAEGYDPEEIRVERICRLPERHQVAPDAKGLALV
jgi:hypothetical protein